MNGNDPYRLSFEIECHKHKDHLEFCRVFFRPTSQFPRHLLFGMDNEHFTRYKHFKKENAGMVVNRHDKLVLYVCNKRTGENTQLSIDLEPHWPADLSPDEVKVQLAEIDITAAIGELLRDGRRPPTP